MTSLSAPPTFNARDALVDTAWLARHHSDLDVRVLEVSEGVHLYATGHVPGAVQLDGRRDLWDPVIRDILTPFGLTALMSRLGVTPETTVMLYGNKNHWWATYAYSLLKYHRREHVKLVNGGRQKLTLYGFNFTTDLPTITPSEHPVPERDGTFKRVEQLQRVHESAGVTTEREVITYFRIAERSSHNVVRPDATARLRQRAKRRRVVDRMGQRRPRAHRAQQ